MKFLGIDTSNYTSSVAVAEDNNIILDLRKILEVKQGERGLRQSDALYQHWSNLPFLLEPALTHTIDGIVVSIKPRPQEGSYMPVFNAGKSIAQILSNALNVPLYELSHQEGHILSALHGNTVDFNKPVVCAHLSGGTLEIIKIEKHTISIVGKTKDISYGQLIDRFGVLKGMQFPCGKYIDQMSLLHDKIKNPLSKIYLDGYDLNISGIETQISKIDMSTEELCFCLMERISESFVELINRIGIEQVLVTGGVASSQFLRNYCSKYGYIFGEANLCSDNAVGLALSEGVLPWQ